VVSRLQKIDPIGAHSVHQSVLLRYSSRPTTCQYVSKRFRFPDSSERIAQNSFHQIEDSKRDISVRLDPVLQIFPEFQLKDGGPLTFLAHPTSLLAIAQRWTASACLFPYGGVPTINGAHSSAIVTGEPSRLIQPTRSPE
jgi:hypothetical protein